MTESGADSIIFPPPKLPDRSRSEESVWTSDDLKRCTGYLSSHREAYRKHIPQDSHNCGMGTPLFEMVSDPAASFERGSKKSKLELRFDDLTEGTSSRGGYGRNHPRKMDFTDPAAQRCSFERATKKSKLDLRFDDLTEGTGNRGGYDRKHPLNMDLTEFRSDPAVQRYSFERALKKAKLELRFDDLMEGAGNRGGYNRKHSLKMELTEFRSDPAAQRCSKWYSFEQASKKSKLELRFDDLMEGAGNRGEFRPDLPLSYRMSSELMLEKSLPRYTGLDGCVLIQVLEIFSISIHWSEKKKNMGDMCYHLYGNIFIDDNRECCQKAMERSPNHPFTVSNGDNFPLRVHCLIGEPRMGMAQCHVFVCLMGHALHNCVKCRENESRILTMGDLTIDSYFSSLDEELDEPVERMFAEADDHVFLKMHYSIISKPVVLGVVVKLLCHDIVDNLGPICINGQLSVHWFEFEGKSNVELRNYKIKLFDTKQLDSLPRVSIGDCFPIWRRKLAVPFGYNLVFDVDIDTDKGDKFKGQHKFPICGEKRIFKGIFAGCSLDMEIVVRVCS